MLLPVHPRVCGEHFLLEYQWFKDAGSSPRVRGTYYYPVDGVQFPRFIPACAGNILLGIANHNEGSVHPRVCGEHYNSGGLGFFYRGSSPRVRGTY